MCVTRTLLGSDLYCDFENFESPARPPQMGKWAASIPALLSHFRPWEGGMPLLPPQPVHDGYAPKAGQCLFVVMANQEIRISTAGAIAGPSHPGRSKQIVSGDFVSRGVLENPQATFEGELSEVSVLPHAVRRGFWTQRIVQPSAILRHQTPHHRSRLAPRTHTGNAAPSVRFEQG